MFQAKKPNSIVGLDIESGSIAATEVSANGSSPISRTAIEPLAPGIVAEGEVQDTDALADALRKLFSKNKLSKSVRVGVANQRVVARTIRLPLIEKEDELETALRFQAQEQIPMPLDQAVLDHFVVSRQNGPGGDRHMDVVAVAARRDMVSSLLGALRKAGLRPIGIDLSAFGLIRALDPGALVPEQEGAAPAPVTLFCHLGDSTNLAVARGAQCLFTRTAPYGLAAIASELAGRFEISTEEAGELMLEVGLDEPIEDFEPDELIPGGGGKVATAAATREALSAGASKLVDELRISLDFYTAQEGAPPVERVIVCGPGSTIDGLPERLQAGLGLGIELLSPPALAHLDEEDAARLTVAYGLALEA